MKYNPETDGTKINPEFKAKWLAALRSGDYAQSQETLRDSSGYCCLGVACDIRDPSAWVSEMGDTGEGEYDVDGERAAVGLNEPLMKEFGMTDKNMNVLIHLNDSESWSFDEIANWIENNL